MSGKTNKLPSVLLDDNIAGKGWKPVENVKPSKFEVKDLELVSFLENGEESIKGEVMHQRAIRLRANLGLEDVKYILDHQAEIPVEFRGKFLLFPGTLFDCLHIVCLFWKDGEWCPAFLPTGFGFNFDDEDLLVRSKSAGKAQA